MGVCASDHEPCFAVLASVHAAIDTMHNTSLARASDECSNTVVTPVMLVLRHAIHHAVSDAVCDVRLCLYRQVDRPSLPELTAKRHACVFSVQCGTHTHLMAASTAAEAQVGLTALGALLCRLGRCKACF